MHDKDGQPVWFAKDDVNVCMLPSTMAEQLGVRPGDTIDFMGQPLTVLGIWDARVVKRDADGQIVLDQNGQPITSLGPLDRLTDLDAQPITPLKFAVVSQGDAEPPAARGQHRHDHPAAALPRGPPHPAGQHLVADRHPERPGEDPGAGRAS